MAVTTANYQITWEKLPDDCVLPDDPVDNIDRPILAATCDNLSARNALVR